MLLILVLSCTIAAAFADVSTTEKAKQLPTDIEISSLRAHPRFVMTPNGPVPHPAAVGKTHDTKTSVKESTVVAKPPFDDKKLLIPGAMPEATTQHAMTVQEEMKYLQERMDVIRKDIDQWMESPHHRNVELPIILGAVSAIMVIIFYKVLQCLFKLCSRLRRRGILSRITRNMGSENKNLLTRKTTTCEDNDITI